MMYDNTAGAGGGIFKTTDGGASWTQSGAGQIFDANSFPDVIYFWDANNGFAMGDPNGGYYEIYHTTDGGANWTRVPQANIPPPVPATQEYGIVNDFEIIDSTIWFGTNKGRIYKSVDGGYNWTVANCAPNTKTIGSIAFRDAMNGLAYANNTSNQFALYRTSDGGTTWSAVTTTGNIYKSDITAVPGTMSYISCGASGTGGATRGSALSIDDGTTWTVLDSAGSGTTDGYTIVKFWDASTGWAGGFNADAITDGIYKWGWGPAGIKDVTPLVKSDITAFPNPSAGLLNIEFKNKNASDVNIAVSDLTGKIVWNKNFKHAPVQFRQTFDFSSLPKGSYIVTVTTNNEVSKQKLVLN